MALVRDSHNRVVFEAEGPSANDAAEQYLAMHYPHLHADPNIRYDHENPEPDAAVEYDDYQ